MNDSRSFVRVNACCVRVKETRNVIRYAGELKFGSSRKGNRRITMTEGCDGHEVPCTSNDTCERRIMDDEVQRELPSKYVTDHEDCEGGTYVFYPTWEEFK